VGEPTEFFNRSERDYGRWDAMNLETNCGDHTVSRMLEEGDDLNAFFRYDNPRLLGRAASFCMERSGYNEAGLNDQGLAFFLPNMTWIQPPGYVHHMVARTWQPNNVEVTYDCENVSISAQASEDAKALVVRVTARSAVTLAVDFAVGVNGRVKVTSANSTTIHWPSLAGANTPAQPDLIKPVESAVLGLVDGSGLEQARFERALAQSTYAVFQFELGYTQRRT
jgi:hypothetical protein